MRNSRMAGFLSIAVLSAGTMPLAHSTELPVDDPGLFSYLFTQKTIPADWIYTAAREELTPAMMENITMKLSSKGGKYQNARKIARGWKLGFQNGTVRARIVRANDHKIIGVFFSDLE